jgi:hypothetical protein
MAALLGAILGAIIPSFVTWRISERAFTVEIERSEHEFIRSQRRDAYGAFLSALIEYDSLQHGFAIDYSKPSSQQLALTNAQKVYDAKDRVERAGTIVTVIGSAKTSSLVDGALAACRDATGKMYFVINGAEFSLEEFQRFHESISTHVRNFTAAARGDLVRDD